MDLVKIKLNFVPDLAHKPPSWDKTNTRPSDAKQWPHSGQTAAGGPSVSELRSVEPLPLWAAEAHKKPRRMRARWTIGYLIWAWGLAAQALPDSLRVDSSLALWDFPEFVLSVSAFQAEAWPSLTVQRLSAEDLRLAGRWRLDQALAEQTGLAIVNNHGQGLQIQGLGSDYILILLDGMPLIGRTAGTFDLSRLALGSVKSIEVQKGASSGLYGSEALAGVVQIETEQPEDGALLLSGRYGRFGQRDVNLQWGKRWAAWQASVFANHHGSQGYDLDAQSLGQTVEPFSDYTLQVQTSYRPNLRQTWQLSGRYYRQGQRQVFGTNQGLVQGQAHEQDWMLHAQGHYYHGASGNWSSRLQYYQMHYDNRALLYLEGQPSAAWDSSYFRQQLYRPEYQLRYRHKRGEYLHGLGFNAELVAASRYTQMQQMQQGFIYGHYRRQFGPNIELALGWRGDWHSIYGGQLSPKLQFKQRLGRAWSWEWHSGRGFKAPDFRQLYLNFSNAVAGYSVLGAEELPAALARLQAEGQLARLFFQPEEAGGLQAERSWGHQLLLRYQPSARFFGQLGLFRQDLQNLIEVQPFALRENGQTIFSYRNLSRIYTQGLEAEFSYCLASYWRLAGGYQYLRAEDKAVVEALEAGQIFGRDAQTGQARRLERRDYGGLMNRSRHQANLKLSFQYPKHWEGSLRLLYRGRFGFGDRNGNLILDAAEEYVRGHALLNLSLGKAWGQNQRFRLQIGVDNLLNYRDPLYLPGLPGSLYWLNFSTRIFKPS